MRQSLLEQVLRDQCVLVLGVNGLADKSVDHRGHGLAHRVTGPLVVGGQVVEPDLISELPPPTSASDIRFVARFELTCINPGVTTLTYVADANPEVVAELTKLADWARTDIGDYNRAGENARFFDPQPKRPDIKKK